MRYLILNTDYPAFLEQLYRNSPGLRECSFDDQLAARHLTFFGVGDAYSVRLRELGHWALDLHVNNVHLQGAWARENGATLPDPRRRAAPRLRRGFVPWIGWTEDTSWQAHVLSAQIDAYQPDVIYNQDLNWMAPAELRRLVGSRLLVGQHAAPPLAFDDYSPYDLVFSSWPPTRERMRADGVRCEPLRLGFDPRVLAAVGAPPRDLPLTFVGSLGSLHGLRVRFLEELCVALPQLSVWAPDANRLERGSPLRARCQGAAFGIDMYRILARSQVTLNHHGFAEPHANNMRLYEATGVGALLLTDAKPDLGELFLPGQEVLTYTTVRECAEVVTGLGEDDRVRIAAAGQRRTLADHTWSQRVDTICDAVQPLLDQRV